MGTGNKRERLPVDRKAVTQKIEIKGFAGGGIEGYITVGLYPDGRVGEIFLVLAKEGSLLAGIGDALAKAVSIALQYGTPLEAICGTFTGLKFDPGRVIRPPCPELTEVDSLADFIGRWLAWRFLSTDPPAGT